MNKIDQLKEIVNDFSNKEINGVIVDAQTANVILTVYDALGDRNKEKFINHDIVRMSDIAWNLIK